jgi:transcription termination factor NusB
VKPIDEKMGYTKNDGEIYKHNEFKDLLKSCFRDNKKLQNEIEATYKNLSFDMLD